MILSAQAGGVVAVWGAFEDAAPSIRIEAWKGLRLREEQLPTANPEVERSNPKPSNPKAESLEVEASNDANDLRQLQRPTISDKDGQP